MDKKIIQEQRKKGYFIEAASKIIKNEGVTNLTVKKVANLAGFSPGTLYNYFDDLNDLLIQCGDQFMDKCKDYVLSNIAEGKGIKEQIVTSIRSYVEFFIDNPNVFQLVYLEDIGDVSDKAPEVVFLLDEALREGVSAGLIPETQLEMKRNLISSAMHGILLFYIKRRTKSTREEVLKLIEEEVKYILDVCYKK
ncbi:MAG: TetR/AcrR family transcriptional regulator [Halothermotrichaceae bacterium]